MRPISAPLLSATARLPRWANPAIRTSSPIQCYYRTSLAQRELAADWVFHASEHQAGKSVSGLGSPTLMIAQSRHPIEVVARETGFGGQERMRRAFVRVLRQSLQPMRRGAERAEPVRMAET
jgi:hypothetical protein